MIDLLLATLLWFVVIGFVYYQVGVSRILDCYQLWFTKKYWTDYNIIEALSWFTKAIIIVPGLIFSVEIWWLYAFTLITSVLLIWASNKKLLPTLVGFNTLWVWMSLVVLTRSLL